MGSLAVRSTEVDQLPAGISQHGPPRQDRTVLASQPVLVRKSEPQFCTFDRWSLVRTLITIFWDMAVFFRLMLLMLLTFVFAFCCCLAKSIFCILFLTPTRRNCNVLQQRLYDQPFSVVGIGEMMWYVYVHGVFGDADDPPGGGDAWQHDSQRQAQHS